MGHISLWSMLAGEMYKYYEQKQKVLFYKVLIMGYDIRIFPFYTMKFKKLCFWDQSCS